MRIEPQEPPSGLNQFMFVDILGGDEGGERHLYHGGDIERPVVWDPVHDIGQARMCVTAWCLDGCRRSYDVASPDGCYYSCKLSEMDDGGKWHTVAEVADLTLPAAICSALYVAARDPMPFPMTPPQSPSPPLAGSAS